MNIDKLVNDIRKYDNDLKEIALVNAKEQHISLGKAIDLINDSVNEKLCGY